VSKQTPENLVKREVKDWLTLMGWFHFPILQGLGSYPGIPDIIAVKNGVVLFIECKAPGGQLSEAQRKFRQRIYREGCHYIKAHSFEDIEDYLEWEL